MQQGHPSTSGFQTPALRIVLMPAVAWCSDSLLSPMNSPVQALGRQQPGERSSHKLKGLGRMGTLESSLGSHLCPKLEDRTDCRNLKCGIPVLYRKGQRLKCLNYSSTSGEQEKGVWGWG